MRIWFLEVGEPSPLEENVRLHRYGLLTQYLASKGHDVTWWTSSFSHAPKKQVVDQSCDKIWAGVRLKIIRGPGYPKNVSIARLRHYDHFCSEFRRLSEKELIPDIVVAPVPTLEIACDGIRYAKKHGIPVITDIRDEWPEEFANLAPKAFRPLAKLALFKLYQKIRFICSNVDGIVGVSRRQLAYGLQYSGRRQSEADIVLPHGYSAMPVADEKLAAASAYWTSLGVNPNDFNACFFGTIGRYFELDTVIEAAKRLKGNPVKFILCGDGSRLAEYKIRASGIDSILFPGWVDGPKIAALMRMSKVGLAPYANGVAMSLPNKPFEYFAGGLPVLSSIQTELKDILSMESCGSTYKATDVDDFVSRIRSYMETPELAKSHGENARAVLERDFSTESIVQKWERYLSNIVKSSPKRHK